MANYKVTDAQLTAMANAVRAKTGGTSPIEWKAGKGFADEVAEIDAFTALDEGKVVNNGELVAQGSQSVTENGTYDTTLKNQVIVDVPTEGGGAVIIKTAPAPQNTVAYTCAKYGTIGTKTNASGAYGRVGIGNKASGKMGKAGTAYPSDDYPEESNGNE